MVIGILMIRSPDSSTSSVRISMPIESRRFNSLIILANLAGPVSTREKLVVQNSISILSLLDSVGV